MIGKKFNTAFFQFRINTTSGTEGTVNWRFRLFHYLYLRGFMELDFQLFCPLINYLY